MKEKNVFSGIYGLRAVACLMVLLLHAFSTLDWMHQGAPLKLITYLVTKTNLGVTLFFVLSGFLLSHPFWGKYLSGS